MHKSFPRRETSTLRAPDHRLSVRLVDVENVLRRQLLRNLRVVCAAHVPLGGGGGATHSGGGTRLGDLNLVSQYPNPSLIFLRQLTVK